MNNMSRREFLSAVGGVALAGAVPLPRFGQNPILGSGSHRYECIHDWLTPPDGMAFGDTHGLTQDSRGNIYVSHTVHASSTSADAVCVYSEDGKFLRSWGSQFKGGAHGLDIRKEGREEFIYHCDTNKRNVVKTKLDGTVVWEQGVPMASGKYSKNEPYIPTNVAFGPNGMLFVADGYGSNWIHVYDAKGNYQKTITQPGAERGQVLQPHGLWVDDRGKTPFLVVADRSNRRLQYFDLDGQHVCFVKAGMRLPCHFSIREGELLVPDLQSVVTILDEDNRVIVHLGDGDPTNLRGRPRSEFVPGKFVHPHDAIFLRNGDILVSEWVPFGRVTLLRRV